MNVRIARAGCLALFSAVLLMLSACSPERLSGDMFLGASTDEAPRSLNGSTVSGEITVYFEATSTLEFADTSFRLNDAEPGELLQEPDSSERYAIALDTAQLFDGEHALTVTALDEEGEVFPGEVSATFVVKNRGTPHGAQMPRAEGYPLRGVPGLNEAILSHEMRLWYERLWSAVRDTGDEQAQSGSLRDYGYSFQQHMMFLFTALRATGDLRFADEIARIADIMASALTTEWYDPRADEWYAPTDGTAGHRRWVYLRDDEMHDRVGKDTDEISTYKTHAVVAIMAHMFDVNRGLSSPGGVDYGAKADFWLDYLLNDFEAIQHQRNGTSHPHDVFRSDEGVGMSVLHSQLAYHRYMHKATGDDERQAYANAAADMIAASMYTLGTPIGPAVVFGRPHDPEGGLMPIAYARYTWALLVDLALDGHPLFGNPAYVAMHARTLAHFVLDNGTTDLSFDVGGMEERTGISWLDETTVVTLPTQNPYTTSSLTWGRESFNRYVLSYMAPLAAFGAKSEIAAISTDVYQREESDPDNPEDLAIPTGMLLAEAFAW